MKINNAKVNNSARKEEVLAYIIFEDYIFKNKEFVVGDKLEINMPDIYSTDAEIGAEVVTCETFNNYLRTHFKMGIVHDKPLFKQKKKLYQYVPKVQLKEFVPQNQEYYEKLEEVLNKKLQNLSVDHYKCKEIYLLVLSNFAHKKNISTTDVFETVKQQNELFKKRYKNIYIVVDNKILSVDDKNNCKILKDFNKYIDLEK